MKKKTYFICAIMSLCIFAEAQNTGRLISASVKVGPIFLGRVSDVDYSISNEQYNKWNIDLTIEENKFGFGLTARYITSNITRTAIPNPLVKPLLSFDRQTLEVGDIVRKVADYSNWSFLVNKRILIAKNRHRLDFCLGTQFRRGSIEYFQDIFGWEIRTTGEYLDKYGFLSRFGYTYMLGKHISLTTNVEYAKFKKDPSEFFDFNVLVGVRF